MALSNRPTIVPHQSTDGPTGIDRTAAIAIGHKSLVVPYQPADGIAVADDRFYGFQGRELCGDTFANADM